MQTQASDKCTCCPVHRPTRKAVPVCIKDGCLLAIGHSGSHEDWSLEGYLRKKAGKK